MDRPSASTSTEGDGPSSSPTTGFGPETATSPPAPAGEKVPPSWREPSLDFPGETAGGTVTAPPQRAGAQARDSKPSASEVPPSLYERFEGFELLGRGGMGAVYRATDVRLRRAVAVKLLFEGDSGSRSGFLQEARSQARILHPNVCEVFEAGVADHVPFIVMRHVGGGALQKMRAQLTLEEKVRIVQEVSLALHEAHRLGIVHRDVKPGNVLVERAEDGSWKTYIADFGIARDVTEDGRGAIHGVQGTPAFMAPEQAAGTGHLDRRTDVYGLGATLYDVLTGRVPFSAPQMRELLRMVREEPPPPPRSVEPTIPLDLEAIVLRCLEKDPDARYESAKALAEDLGRFLDGDPVQARPRSLFVRLWKRARKHKIRVALAGAAVVVALTVAGLWLRSLGVAAQREALARDLGGAVREMELFMRSAHVLPLHDLENERGFLRGRLAQIEARMIAAGEAGVGPGNDALGRGHLALQDAGAALSRFQKAEAAGYRAPGFDYTMGLALIEVYRQELEEANRIQKESDKAARIAEIQRLYREPAITRLRAALAQGVESPPYALGLVAHHEGRHEEALSHAQEAFVGAPWLYEAKKLEGDAYYAIGSRTRADKVTFDYVRTMEQFSQAAEAYHAAAEIARSDPSVHEAECELWTQVMSATYMRHDPIRPPFERARSACERAIAASPRGPSGHVRMALAHQIFSFWVTWGAYPDEPPDRALDEATLRVEEARRRSPDSVLASYLVGAVWRTRVYRLLGASRDTGAALDGSVVGYEGALALDPMFLWALKEECDVLAMRGRREAWRGIDPRPTFDLAHARCRRAREVDPNLTGLGYMVLLVHAFDAERLVASGRSPRSVVEEGLKASEAMEEQVPSEPYITALRAELHRWNAEYALAAGEDPAPALARAEAQVVRLPASFLAGDCSAMVAAVAAEVHLARLKRDPAPRRRLAEVEEALARASRGFRASLAERPHDANSTLWLTWLVQVELAALRYRMALGQARWEDAEAVLAPLGQFRAEPPEEDPRLDEVAARAHEARAELCEELLRDSTAEIASGIERAERAVALGPGLAAGYAVLGRLLVRQARAAPDPGLKKALSSRAARALADAVKRSPLFGRDHAAWIDEAERLARVP
jgi:tetratricopeptide (TPR) repeat protein